SFCFFFSSRRRHTRFSRDWSSDVCSSDLEVRVLRRVEDLEQRRGGVALEGRAQLVHLVEQEHRVLGARLADALDDAARHGADVRAAVAADVGLVARAAKTYADVLAAQRLGDGLRDARLA